MFELKDLIKRAFTTLLGKHHVAMKTLSIEMFFNDTEPIFKCFDDEVLIKNNNVSDYFSMLDLLGFMKYNMLNAMGGAFGGLNNIINSKVKEEADKRGIDFYGSSLLFFLDEVNHDEFRIIDKNNNETYLNFKDFKNE